MPLLRRQQFVRDPLPQDLEPDEELFYCKLTNEVFRDYDAFFERIILCNSLVWTCEMTGKPGLTYAEALESEEAARASLKAMPALIKRLILYFGRLSKRLRLGELCDDVFSYMKGRFFVGEEVDVVVDGNRKACIVVKVIAPRPNRKKVTTNELLNENGKEEGLESVDDSYPDIDSNKFKYKVKQIGGPEGDCFYISPPDITRKKRVYSRDKSKLFLKHTCESVNNVWIVKPKFLEKYRVSELRFKDIFGGAKPNFEAISNWKKHQSHPAAIHLVPNSKLKSKTVEKKPKKLPEAPPSRKRKISEVVEKDNSKAARDAERIRMNKEAALALKKAKRAMEERRKAKEEIKKKMLEQRIKMKEEKEKEREKQREEKRILAECLREWQKPRDDLECDDLTELPSFVPIDCGIPNELFGDAVMIMEFINNFSELLSIKDIFPTGLSLEALENALVERDIQGTLNDLLQLLLKIIFRFQEEEEEDQENIDRLEKQGNNLDDRIIKEEENSRNILSTIVGCHGAVLRKLTLDAFTLTEVLRLHLLSSGSRPNAMDASSHDDPGLQLLKENPDLLKNLSCKSVFEFSPADKLKILQVLVNQLLSHVAIHDEIDERLEKLKIAKLDLRQWQWAEQRREKEEASARMRKRVEDKKAAENEMSNQGGNERKQKDLEEDEERAAEIEMKHKQDYLRKERELSDSVFRLQHRGTLLPLGRDRAYRRYWMFSALPGLYIEDDETEVGSCLPEPTPIDPNVNANMSFNLSVNLARHQALKSCNGVSGKENETSKSKNVNGLTGSLIKSHKLLSDNHPTINGVVDTRLRTSQIEDEEMNGAVEKPVMFGICSADGDKCPTHGSKRKSSAVTWAFVSTSAQLESLISSLNPRGFREGSLKEILVAEKKRVLQSVTKCPSVKLNPEALRLSDNAPSEVRKSSRIQSAAINVVSCDTSVRDYIELTLSDSLLELEEKIYHGGLGSIKCDDRNTWRDAIVNQVFNQAKDDITTNEQQSTEPMINGHLENGTEDDDVTTTDPQRTNCQATRNGVVHKLATSLLQIFQGIEPKYLTPPLGVYRESDSAGKCQPNNLAARWEESLSTATTFSQIFLHLTTLEKSVAWSRSVLNARCRICRRKGDAEHMLLCDGCDRGHHMYCLKPSLEEIPEGDWLCPDCCPKETKSKSRKKRSVVKEEEEEVTKQEPENDVDVSLIDQAVGEIVDESYHPSIVETDDVDEEDDGSEMCSVCEKGGEVISCEMCFLAFHLKCLKPAPRRYPRGRWCCPKCSELTQELRQSTPKTKKIVDKVEKPVKKLVNEAKEPKHANDTGVKRNGYGGGKEEEILDSASPRRSERNMGRKINYRKHSLHDSDDEWLVESPLKKAKRSNNIRQTTELSDDEYYGLTKRHSPPCRRGASEDVPLDYKTCDQLLTELVRHEDGWPFLRPVGKKEVPSYHDIIKRPMDFGTMRSRLNDMMYQNNKEFVADMFLIFQNCCIFNPADSIQYEAAERLGRYFHRRIKEVRLNLMVDNIRIHQQKLRKVDLTDTLSMEVDHCASTEKDSCFSAEKDSCLTTENEPCVPTEKDRCALKEDPCASKEENHCSPIEEELSASTERDSLSPIEEESFASIEKDSWSPIEKEPCVLKDTKVEMECEIEPVEILSNGEVDSVKNSIQSEIQL